jgi:hypothetical protein
MARKPNKRVVKPSKDISRDRVKAGRTEVTTDKLCDSSARCRCQSCVAKQVQYDEFFFDQICNEVEGVYETETIH